MRWAEPALKGCGCLPKVALEVACQMTLIGEARLGRHIRGGGTFGKHCHRPTDPQRQDIGVRCKTKTSAECADDLKAAAL